MKLKLKTFLIVVGLLLAIPIVFSYLQVYGIPFSDLRIERARVLENNLGCSVDATCYLRLEDGKIIDYGRGWSSCNYNPDEHLLAGDYVKVYAKHTLWGYEVCGNSKYFIKKL